MANEARKPVNPTVPIPAPPMPAQRANPSVPAPPVTPPPQAAAPRFSKRRLAVAFTIAALSDGLSAGFAFVPPLEIALDVVTASLLFAVFGWQWLLLPGLIMEAIPVVAIFPSWLLVVSAIAAFGTVRPMSK